MSLLYQFRAFIAKENLFPAKDKLLLAVSGGIDSVVLCELCRQAGYDFIIAHCNFQLRGAESERDEQFVSGLGTIYNVPVLVKRFETAAYAAANKVSIQVAARQLRYAWFEEILNDHGTMHGKGLLGTGYQTPPACSWLLTAHHLDDNIETMLMNFFKGTGIAGLRGIMAKQGKIMRPLLFAKKEDLKKFAEDNTLAWVEDSSNQSDKYARNYFRNQLIPLIKNLYPEAESNLAHNLDRFKDIEVLYQQSVEQHKKKLLEYKGQEIHIPVQKLQQTVPLVAVLYEIIKVYHFSPDQVPEAIALLKSETGRFIQSATHRVIRNRNWLIISPNQTTEAAHILIPGPGKVEFGLGAPGGSLELVLHPCLAASTELNLPVSPNIACLDARGISFPLLLRRWKTGDYFYPLGMRRKKKLSRFFIDQKLSKTGKERTWVLESNKKIIWVVGQRIDERCKITASTTQLLRITLKEPVYV